MDAVSHQLSDEMVVMPLLVTPRSLPKQSADETDQTGRQTAHNTTREGENTEKT